MRTYVYCHDAPLDCADPSGLAGGEGGGEPGAGPEPGGVLSPEAQAQADVQILRGSSNAAMDAPSGETMSRQLPLFPETDLLTAEQINSPASASIDPASSTALDSLDTTSPSSSGTTWSKPKTRGGIYLLRDRNTKEVMRTGRTDDFVTREGNHRRGEDNPATIGLRFEIVYETDNYAEQRGLEQLVYDQYPNAPLNKLRPISPRNSNSAAYLRAAQDFLARPPQP